MAQSCMQNSCTPAAHRVAHFWNTGRKSYSHRFFMLMATDPKESTDAGKMVRMWGNVEQEHEQNWAERGVNGWENCEWEWF